MEEAQIVKISFLLHVVQGFPRQHGNGLKKPQVNTKAEWIIKITKKY